MVLPTKKVSITKRTAAVALLRVAAGASGLGDALLRPREAQLLADGEPGGVEALVERLVRLRSELRVELKLADGSTAWACVARDDAELLELREGQILAVRFTAAPAAPVLAA
jgi:hypothetical protein